MHDKKYVFIYVVTASTREGCVRVDVMQHTTGLCNVVAVCCNVAQCVAVLVCRWVNACVLVFVCVRGISSDIYFKFIYIYRYMHTLMRCYV